MSAIRHARAACLLLLTVAACQGDAAAPVTVPVPVTPKPAEPEIRPVPVLLAATPELVIAGDSTAGVTLTGEGFVRDSRARWNDGDRVTTYHSATQLTIQLSARDVATLGEARVQVYNAPPAGGTSGTLRVTVGNPRPTLTQVTPASATIGASDLTITVNGTNFLSGSRLYWNEYVLSTTYVGPTQLTGRVPSFLLGQAGRSRITVATAPPGGGISAGLDFDLGNPRPTLVAVSPDTLLLGDSVTLTITGTQFVSGATVRWNGMERTTRFVSATQLTVPLAAVDVGAAGPAQVEVANPAPGGGATAAATVQVREAPPNIVSLTPIQVTVGAPPFTLTVRGAQFSSQAVVWWNGAPLATRFVDGGMLTVSVPAALVAQPGGGRVTVVNPGTSGTSRPVTVAILQPAATSPVSGAFMPIRANHIVYDSTHQLMYATVGSTAPQYANSVIAFSPFYGGVQWSVFVGSEPARMAVTDDGRFLYVGLNGAPSVVRVDLLARTKELEFQLGQGLSGQSFAEDLESVPGSPRSVIVSRRNACCSPRHDGVGIYDDGVMRRDATPGHTGSNRIVRGRSPSEIFGYNNETTGFGLFRVLVSPTGLRTDRERGGVFSGFGIDLERDVDGRIYTTNGAVADMATMSRIGTFPTSGLVQPDSRTGRVFFFSGGTVSIYHYFTFAPLGTLNLSNVNDATLMVRFPPDGLVLGGGAIILITRSPLLGG